MSNDDAVNNRKPRKPMAPIIVEKWEELPTPRFVEVATSASLDCENSPDAVMKIVTEKLESGDFTPGTYRFIRQIRGFKVAAQSVKQLSYT